MKKISAFVACLIATVVPAGAQDAIVALDTTLMAGWSGNNPVGTTSRRRVGQQITQRRRTVRPASTSPAQAIARTSFQPDAAARNRVYARAVATMQRVSPPDAAKLRAELVSGRMHKAVADYLGRYGMSTNNLVDTTTIYLAAAWFASRANTGDPTPAQMKGLRAQVASIYATMPQVLTASPALKQELSEANVLQAWVSSSIANQAAADTASAPRLRAAAVQGVKATYQLDLSRMNLTNQGLR